MADKPLIYDPAEIDEAVEVGPTNAADDGPLDLDESRHPWLRGFDERSLAKLAIDLTDFLCRPSFGARTKREIEFETFALLRGHRPDWVTLGDIADDLAIARAKARSLVLEYNARTVGRRGFGARREILRDHVRAWPAQQIEREEDRLKIVIDDPFVRDLLKNFAYGRGILLDQSFASEIQTFSWDSYARLLAALYGDGISQQDFLTLSADLRKQIRQAAATNAAVKAELEPQLQELEKLAQKARKSPEERRRELALEILRKYGPALASLAWKHVGQ
jgi:hypothetical protein